MRTTIIAALLLLLVLPTPGCAEFFAIAAQNYKIAVAAGADSDTDAFGGGVELQLNGGGGAELGLRAGPTGATSNPASAITIVPGVFFGFGDQDFGDVDPTSGDPLSYTVLQLGVHGQYAIPLNADGSFQAYPLAGPAYYRFSYSDCPFADECSENIFLLDLGGGVQYGNFAVEAFTAIEGPTFRARAKYLIPLQ